MRDLFGEYYPPTDQELAGYVESASVVIDANVLLHVYRYSPDAAGQMIAILQKLDTRLWMPHQVALEFHRNRASVIFEQSKAYDDVNTAITEIRDQIRKSFSGRDLHPFIRRSEILDRLLEPLDAEETQLRTLKEMHEQQSSKAQEFDAHWNELDSIYRDLVGAEYTAAELETLYLRGEDRYQKNVPPGFRDAKTKDSPDKFGDFILWSQILDKYEAEPNDVVFVTDDRKEDWWRKISGRNLGALPALKKEFFDRTGKRVHLYSSDEFINHFASLLDVPLDQETRQEVERVSSAGDNWHESQELIFRDLTSSAWKERLLRRHTETERVVLEASQTSMAQLGIEREIVHLQNLQEEAAWLQSRLDDEDRHGNASSSLHASIRQNRTEIEVHRSKLLHIVNEQMSSIDGFEHEGISPSLMRLALEVVSQTREK